MSLLIGDKEIEKIAAAAKSIADEAGADADARIRAIVAGVLATYVVKITFEKKEQS